VRNPLCWTSFYLTAFALAAVARADAIDSQIYFPMAPGDEWVWADDSQTQSTDTILATPGQVGGQATLVDQVSGGPYSGSTTDETSDENGIRLYRGTYPNVPVAGYGLVTASLTFTPPVAFVPRTASLGDSFSSAGTATFVYYGLTSFSLPYQSSSHLVGVEPVSVPFGSFSAVRFEWSLSMNGLVGTQYLSLSETETAWLVAGVGPVELELDGPQGVVHEKLVSTNLTPVPEPSTDLLQAAGVATVVLAWWGSRRRRVRAEVASS